MLQRSISDVFRHTFDSISAEMRGAATGLSYDLEAEFALPAAGASLSFTLAVLAASAAWGDAAILHRAIGCHWLRLAVWGSSLGIHTLVLLPLLLFLPE
jgi:hypothetical protein